MFISSSQLWAPLCTAWLNWINYVAARCCVQLACVGFDTLGKLKWHLHNRDSWKSTNRASS